MGISCTHLGRQQPTQGQTPHHKPCPLAGKDGAGEFVPPRVSGRHCPGQDGAGAMPVAVVLGHMALLGNQPGPFFLTPMEAPLLKHFFISELRAVLTAQGFPAEQYVGHNFRIGVAQQLEWHVSLGEASVTPLLSERSGEPPKKRQPAMAANHPQRRYYFSTFQTVVLGIAVCLCTQRGNTALSPLTRLLKAETPRRRHPTPYPWQRWPSSANSSVVPPAGTRTGGLLRLNQTSHCLYLQGRGTDSGHWLEN